MVAQLDVSAFDGETSVVTAEDGREFRLMRRMHTREGSPFCRVDIRLDNTVFEQAPKRFCKEIVVTVLKDIGVAVSSARQKITISYADFELAQALRVNVNSPVFKVFREFFDTDGQLIYSAKLIYPGDLLEMEIEFAVDQAQQA